MAELLVERTRALLPPEQAELYLATLLYSTLLYSTPPDPYST